MNSSSVGVPQELALALICLLVLVVCGFQTGIQRIFPSLLAKSLSMFLTVGPWVLKVNPEVLVFSTFDTLVVLWNDCLFVNF